MEESEGNPTKRLADSRKTQRDNRNKFLMKEKIL